MEDSDNQALREELARRLKDVANTVPTGDLGGSDINRTIIADAVADECLRQMEWARRECTDKTPDLSATPIAEGHIPLKFLPLTLAPADWQP